LFYDLSSREIAGNSVQAAGAENASHATANLCADAGGVPAILLEEDALNKLIIVKPEQQLLRPVTGFQVPGNPRPQGRELAGQAVAQLARQIGHLVESFGSPSDNPAANLAGAQRRLSLTLQPVHQFITSKIEDCSHGSALPFAVASGMIVF
jgi:hypothetical protein